MMARKQTLKVFRTPIGFHDAFVAAPSQKAALQAWGSDADLFARGLAERVEDPELMREPLAKPGTVVRRLRGTAAEHLAALPPETPKQPVGDKAASEDERVASAAPAHKAGRAKSLPTPKPVPKPKPRPDRGALERAEGVLTEVQDRHARERSELSRRQAELDREQRSLEKRQETESSRAAQQVDKARAAYDRAIRAWRG